MPLAEYIETLISVQFKKLKILVYGYATSEGDILFIEANSNCVLLEKTKSKRKTTALRMNECFSMAPLLFKQLSRKASTSDTHSNLAIINIDSNFDHSVLVACSELGYTLLRTLQSPISMFGESEVALAVMSTGTSPVTFADGKCSYVG